MADTNVPNPTRSAQATKGDSRSRLPIGPQAHTAIATDRMTPGRNQGTAVMNLSMVGGYTSSCRTKGV